MEIICLNEFKTFDDFFDRLSRANNEDIIFLDIKIFSGNQDDYNKIIEMNKMIDYLKEHGQQYYYRTPACHPSEELMTFDEFMEMEGINEKLQETIRNKDYDDAHKIRLIETYLAKNMRVLYDDGNSHCLFNMVQSIKLSLGTCRHFNYLDHYLLTRNFIMSLVASNKLKKSSHVYLIVYLKDREKWTCIDSTWSAQDISMETGSYWSFLSYTDIIKYDPDGHHDLSDKTLTSLDTISLTPNDIHEMDKDIGIILNDKKDFYIGADFALFLKYYLGNDKETARLLKESDDKTISNNIMKATLLLFLWSEIFDLRGTTPGFYVFNILSHMISKENFCKAKFYYSNDKNKDSSNIIVSVWDFIDGKEECSYFVHTHTDRTFCKYSREELIGKLGGKIKVINSSKDQSLIYGISISNIETSGPIRLKKRPSKII